MNTSIELHIWEVAIRGFDKTLTKQAKEGDIIVVRKPLNFLGKAEEANFLWLHLTGLPDQDMQELIAPVMSSDLHVEKRRYTIPLHRLQKRLQTLNVSGFMPQDARDPSKQYQPLLFTSQIPPLKVQGLVYDKQQMRYL